MSRILRRLASMLFVVWGVVTLTFLINYALPGDPARAIAGPQARPADLRKIREQLGLARPLHVQYGLFLSRLVHVSFDRQLPETASAKDAPHASCSTFGPVHLDLGMSYQKRQPVGKLLGDRLPATLLLALAATFVQVAIGVTTGVLAALRRGTVVDTGIVTLTLVGISAPTFVIGIALQYVLAYRLQWLPLDGYGQTFGERLFHVFLPALTLGLYGAAYYTRLVRDEVLTQEREDYARTALAKGASHTRVLLVHVLRNAIVPLVTVVGLDLGALVGGAIVTEKLFRWPGVGRLAIDAVAERDGPVILGTVLLGSVAVVVASLVVDASYGLLDPRARRKSS
jgi:peptide/nickel transport system permease protein